MQIILLHLANQLKSEFILTITLVHLMSHPEKISCIVVTYNAEHWIEKCLNSVLQSTIGCSIVVLDNNSEDRTSEIIKSQFPQVTFIQNEENLGFGKANNKAIQLAYDAGTDYFFLLNQDAWVEPQAVEQLVGKLKQHPEYGILSPLQYYNSEKLDRKFKSYLKSLDEQSIQQLSVTERDSIVDVRFVNAALWLMSRRCIETVGLFAPIFDHYGEDQNYAHRCKFHQLKMGVYLKAIGYHEREQSVPKVTNVKLRKLLVRDRSYCMAILLNLKHSFLRQCIFLLLTGIKEIFLFLFLLKFKTIVVILYRIIFIRMFFELINQRKEMKKKAAFLAHTNFI